MSGIPLIHSAGELPGVAILETFVLATLRRATIAALASAVAITVCSAAGPDTSSAPTTSALATTSPVDESSPSATVREHMPLTSGSGSMMVEKPQQCESHKYWSYWKYTQFDFESIMACKP